MKSIKILIVDDEIEFSNLLDIILTKEGYDVSKAYSGREAVEKLKNGFFDIVLTDMMMKDMDGMELLGHVNTSYPDVDCIVVTAYGSVENAVEAMKKGAFSYFIKSNDPQELIFDIQKIIKMKNLHHENLRLKSCALEYDYILDSKNKKFQSIVKYAEKVAKTDANVMIIGESGVGKEIIARYIHNISDRRNNVFMAVNCFSFSESMLEAELYGHEKGSFTGSTHTRIGRFEAANKGTLFLDEVGDIPLSVQTKILRNIERKEIERIGSNTTIPVNFRLISATNRDLKHEISIKNFREDLYYRLNTVLIEIPSLRDRREDLPLFIEYFLNKACKDLKKSVEKIDSNVLSNLLKYEYPGNVRELKNIMERLVVISEGKEIKSRDIAPYNIFSDNFSENEISLRSVRHKAEKSHILNVLESCDYDFEKSAKWLEISVRQLYNKIKEYDISKK